jgi:HAD superfamily phosphatase (TIGR01668 family)
MVSPQRLAPRLCEVPLGELLAEGVRGLILDLDNTLVGYGRQDIDERDRQWVAAARAAGVAMVMLSNNTTGKVRWASAELGIPGIDWALKPLPHGFRRAVAMIGLPREQIRVIGDQFFTDILGARLAGVSSILVEPIVARDWAGTRILRGLERLVLPHRRSP